MADGSDLTAGPSIHHALGIYDTSEFLVRVAADYVRESLQAQAIVALVLPAAVSRRVEIDLSASGVDVTGALDRGEVVPVDADELFEQLTSGGGLDAGGYRTSITELRELARDRGAALHVCGNLHSMLWEAGHIDALLELEGMWNGSMDHPPLRLLCLYASHVFREQEGDDRFLSLCRQHGEVRPVEDFASLVDPVDDLSDRPVALLEQQEQARRLDRDELVSEREAIEEALQRCIADADRQHGEFERAVASRDVIGQAKGIIMARWHVDAREAFQLLRDASSRSHRKLHDVASAVVDQQLRRH